MDPIRLRQLRREKTILQIMLDPRKELKKRKRKELRERYAEVMSELRLVTEEDRIKLIDERRAIFCNHIECNQIIYSTWLFLAAHKCIDKITMELTPKGFIRMQLRLMRALEDYQMFEEQEGWEKAAKDFEKWEERSVKKKEVVS